MDVLDLHSIVDYDSVIKKHSFTRLDLLLATVFSASIRERIAWIGTYLVDMLLNGSILNSSIEYPSKVCILLCFLGDPLSDTEMEIPDSWEHSIGGYVRLPLMNY